MRCRVIALVSVAFLALSGLSPATAEEKKADVKGLFLLTDHPAVTLRPGTNSTINLRLQNYNLPPERLPLSLSGAPPRWPATRCRRRPPTAAPLPATHARLPLALP